MSITRPNPFQQAGEASKLSAVQLQQAIKDGTVPPYIGVPLLQQKVKQERQMQAAMAAQQPKPPTVADQVMAEAQQMDQGVPSLQSNLPMDYRAAGGIIAFAEGGEADDDMPTFELAAEEDEAAQDAEDEALYGGLGRAPRGKVAEYAQTFEQGIGSLPAAEKVAEKVAEKITEGKKEGISGFIDRILHKESRGQRYDKEGNLLTSEKGAKGEMQVMPGTSRDPGFGVKPARDDSPDELARVGRDYAQVMLNRYKDPKIAAIAYNWGPGNTDKWLMAGADFSKLPKETQGYVRGFAQGGEIKHFQNLGLVEDDFTTIPGMYQSNEYERALRRAKGIPDEETKPRYVPGELPKDMQMRMDANYRDVTSNPGILAGTTYADALAKAKGNPPAVDTTPSKSIKDTLLQDAAAKQQSREYLADKISNSDYARQMGKVGGFFGDMGKGALSGIETLGKHLVSAPGYGFSGVNRPEATTASAQQKPYDFTQFDKATERYMNDREQARLANARANEEKARAEVDATKINAPAAAGKKEEATETAAAAPMSRLEDLLTKREENLAKQKDVDKYMAMLTAGLGIMGGTSRHAMANIGQGAQMGIANMMQARKANMAEENALLQGRLGQERYKGTEAYRNAQLEESKLRREGMARERMGQSILSFEKAAQDEAIKQIGQDKLGAMDPAGQAAAIRNKTAEILRSPTYREMLKRYHGENYIEPQSNTIGGANWNYDPTKRTLSGS